MGKLLRLAAAGGLGVVVLTSGLAAADDDLFKACREGVEETQAGGNGLVTVYTDNGATYLGVCGFDRGGYVQVNEISGSAEGEHALVEAKTGNKDVDKAVNNGRIEVWVNGGQDEDDSCAPEGDDAVGNNTGSHVARELPTVYTDGGATRAGVCDDRGNRVQVNELQGAIDGEHDLVEISRD